MPTIQIYKKAHGSLLTSPGDGLLYYTGDFSARANAVNGIFADNPPVLDPARAALIWRYYPDIDRYLLVHVQGSYAVFPSQGRNYPYRAAFEVSRSDINALISTAQGHLPLTALFAAMPRIDEGADTMARRVPTETEITLNQHSPSRESHILATHILDCVCRNKRLVVAMPDVDEPLRCNEIFSASLLSTLLDAISLLPADLARYATFAFCTDSRHAAVADDVLLTFVSPAAAAPDAYSWDAIMAAPATLPCPSLFVEAAACSLPGTDGPLLSIDDMLAAFGKKIEEFRHIEGSDPFCLTADSLQLWLTHLGHSVSELKANSWKAAAKVFPLLSEGEQRDEFVCQHCAVAFTWPIDGLNAQLFEAFAKTPSLRNQLRQQALPVWPDTRYDFLFADTEGRAFLATHVTPDMLSPLPQQSFGRLVTVVGQHSCIPLSTWQAAFGPQQIGALRAGEALDEAQDGENIELVHDAKKRKWLEQVRASIVLSSRPQDWESLVQTLGLFNPFSPVEVSSFALERLAAMSAADYRNCVSSHLDKKSGAMLHAFYASLADYAHTLALCAAEHKDEPRFADIQTTLALAIAEFCHERMMLLCSRRQLLAQHFCSECDAMYQSGEFLWHHFCLHFSLWPLEDLQSLAVFAESLSRSIQRGKTSAEAPLSPASHHLDAIYYIVNAIKHSNMSQDNKSKADGLAACDSKRRQTFARLSGRLPMSPAKRILSYFLVALVALMLGCGAGLLLAPAQSPMPDQGRSAQAPLKGDSLKKDSLKVDSLRVDSISQ